MTAQVLPHPAALLGGRYALLRELGSGGAATVYEAENVLVGKHVAVKVLDEKLANNLAVRARFLAEARAAAQLNHPNVVDIHDVGDERGGLYIVMELLRGETLAEVVSSRGALPVPYACELVLQVLTALGAAHERGIVHRDLKPENILVTHPRPDQPLVKVLDFGIAQGIAGCSAEPEGMLLGTPAYMAPEQALGRRVDHRADLYSTGAVLYELLCGEPPFRGRTQMEVLGAVLQNRYTRIASHAPHVPAELEALIDSLLQPSAHDRPADADAVAACLAPYAGVEASLEPLPIPLIRIDRHAMQFPSMLSLSAPRVHNDIGVAELSDPQFPPSSKLRLDAESWGLPAGTPLPVESEIRARRAPTTAPVSRTDSPGWAEVDDVLPTPTQASAGRTIALAALVGFGAGLVSMLLGGLL